MSSGDPETRRPSLTTWEVQLGALISACYVGPVPQTSRDEGMLIGRNELLQKLGRRVADSAVLVLDGASGSGKTSLLQNGLINKLRDEKGYRVFVCRDWPAEKSSGSIDIDFFLASQVVSTHNQKDSGLDGVKLEDLLDKKLEARDGIFQSRLCARVEQAGPVLLILDQFEELLRGDPDLGSEVVEWVKEAILNYSVRFVISIRTDGTHLLDPLLKGITPHKLDRQTVPPGIDDEFIRGVVEKMREGEGLPTVVLETGLVDTVVELWKRQRHPGLLGLQALLQVAYFNARDASRVDLANIAEATIRIGPDALSEFANENDNAPLDAALERSVRYTMEFLDVACEKGQLDEYLHIGTKELVRRAIPFLSSSGFKNLIGRDALVKNMLEPDARVLLPSMAGEIVGTEALKEALDSAAAVAEGLLSSADLLNAPPENTRSDTVVAPSRHEGSCGPMMGRAGEETLWEEARRAAFAVHWLTTTKLLKESRGILSLMHDGSGAALNAWRDDNAPGIEHAIHRLTGARGEQFDWRDTASDSSKVWRDTASDSSKVWTLQDRTLINLSWRDCRLSMNLRNVVFVNCDFRGARFVKCWLKGVTFVNCVLDDANFEECVFVGSSQLERIDRPGARLGTVRPGPSFTVAMADGGAMARTFARYSSNVTSSDVEPFFSDSVGSPAVPGKAPRGHVGEVLALEPAAGGVALVGGRVCFLTIYGCIGYRSAEVQGYKASPFAMHHVSGDGLDMVEVADASIEIYDCALRGVSFSRDSLADAKSESEGAIGLSLEVHDSVLVWTYVARSIVGEANFVDSIVWGLLNASNPAAGNPGLTVALCNCTYQFVLGVGDTPRSVPVDIGNSDLGLQMEPMDFRFDPSGYEKRRRAQYYKTT